MIVCKTDPYHASRTTRHRGCRILRMDGATPVEWVHDDDYGYGLTLDMARHILHLYASEDSARSGEPNRHRYFSTSYTSDVYTYSIVEMKYYFVSLSEFANLID